MTACMARDSVVVHFLWPLGDFYVSAGIPALFRLEQGDGERCFRHRHARCLGCDGVLLRHHDFRGLRGRYSGLSGPPGASPQQLVYQVSSLCVWEDCVFGLPLRARWLTIILQGLDDLARLPSDLACEMAELGADRFRPSAIGLVLTRRSENIRAPHTHVLAGFAFVRPPAC